jgi:hypothetical protein
MALLPAAQVLWNLPVASDFVFKQAVPGRRPHLKMPMALGNGYAVVFLGHVRN